MKQKIRTEKVNIQKADPKANASVFLFFPTAHFLKTNAEHSRAPLKDKLNNRVILASRTLAYLQAAQAHPQTQACKRANSANALMTNSGLKNGIFTYFDHLKFYNI